MLQLQGFDLLDVELVLSERLAGLTDRVHARLMEIPPDKRSVDIIGQLVDAELIRCAERVDLNAFKAWLLDNKRAEPELVARLTVCGRNRESDYVWARVSNPQATDRDACGHLVYGLSIFAIGGHEAKL